MLERIAFYLARPELREKIAAAGMPEVLAKHTYRHRMEQLLSTMAERVPERGRVVGNARRREGPVPSVFCEPAGSQFTWKSRKPPERDPLQHDHEHVD
jgi:hypothetical protein